MIQGLAIHVFFSDENIPRNLASDPSRGYELQGFLSTEVNNNNRGVQSLWMAAASCRPAVSLHHEDCKSDAILKISLMGCRVAAPEKGPIAILITLR